MTSSPSMRCLLPCVGVLAFLFVGMAPASEPSFLPTLHFKPAGHVLGDVHPYFHEGECFLYYLKPEQFDHTVGLARSTDLLMWRETPVTHARAPVQRPATPDDWAAPWFVLGVFRDPVGQIFRSFYGVGQGRMVSSESRDLLNWDCAPKEYNVPPGDYYKQRRDPYVFWIPEMKRYGCVMTTWMKDSSSRMTGGALSLATSPDLKTWTDHGAVIYPGDMGPPECPQMFTLGGRWYALASITVILWWQDSRHARARVASQCTAMAREQAFRWHASAPWDGRAREIAGEMNGIS